MIAFESEVEHPFGEKENSLLKREDRSLSCTHWQQEQSQGLRIIGSEPVMGST